MEINEEKLYFIDFETGGLKSYVNGVCSGTLKKYNSNFIRNFLFYPQKAIYEYQAFQVNHLSIEELYANGHSRQELINTFGNIAEMDGKQSYFILCGWNVMFDMDFLREIYKSQNAKYPCPIIALDLKEVAANNIKKKDMRKKDDDGVENYRLTTIYQHYFNDFEEEKAHTAQYDCFMVEKLYELFKEKKWI